MPISNAVKLFEIEPARNMVSVVTGRLDCHSQTLPFFEALFDHQPIELSRPSRIRREKRARNVSQVV